MRNVVSLFAVFAFALAVSAEPDGTGPNKIQHEPVRFTAPQEQKVGLNEPQPKVEATPAFTVDARVDFATAYFFRGFNVVNSGSVQPQAKVSFRPLEVGTLSLQPYVATWNNVSGAKGPKSPKNWNESDVNAGVVFSVGKVNIDVGYALYLYPDGFAKSSQEVGFTATYDDSKDGNAKGFTSGSLLPIALNPHVGVYHTFAPRSPGSLTYVEVGVSPHLTINEKLSVDFPVTLGGSPNSVYRNSRGHDDVLGYLTAGFDAKYSLTKNLYLHGGVAYSNLLSSATRESNGGDPNVFIGTVGVGLSF